MGRPQDALGYWPQRLTATDDQPSDRAGAAKFRPLATPVVLPFICETSHV